MKKVVDFCSLPIEKQRKIIKRDSRPRLFGVKVYFRGGSNNDCTLIIWLFWMPIFILPFEANNTTYKILDRYTVNTNVYYRSREEYGRLGWE